MKKIIYLFLFSISFLQNSYACKCSMNPNAINENYISSDIVMLGVILKTYKNNPEDAEYYDVEIEPISLYKGKEITQIKVYGVNDIPNRNNSCTIHLLKNDEWIFFLKENNGEFYLKPCTVSVNKERKQFDIVKERIELCKNRIGELKYDTDKIKVRSSYHKWKSIKHDGKSQQFITLKMRIKKNGELKKVKIIQSKLNRKTHRQINKILKNTNWLTDNESHLDNDVIYLFTFMAIDNKVYLLDGAY